MTKAFDPQLLRRPAVLAKTGLSNATIYRDPTFPKPIRIGERASAWVAAEVDAWIAERIAQRDAGLKPSDPNQVQALNKRMAKRARAA